MSTFLRDKLNYTLQPERNKCVPRLTWRSSHFPAHRGFFLFPEPRHIFFPASQSSSSRKFSSVPAEPPAREGLPPLPLQGAAWQLPRHPSGSIWEINDSAPGPGTSQLPTQTTSQRRHSCSLVVSGSGALLQPVPVPEELRGLGVPPQHPCETREFCRQLSFPLRRSSGTTSDVLCHLEELLPPIPAIPALSGVQQDNTNAWKQLGKSTSLHRPEDNHWNYLGGLVPTIQPTAVPRHLETKHFWRKIKQI